MISENQGLELLKVIILLVEHEVHFLLFEDVCIAIRLSEVEVMTQVLQSEYQVLVRNCALTLRTKVLAPQKLNFLRKVLQLVSYDSQLSQKVDLLNKYLGHAFLDHGFTLLCIIWRPLK